MSKGTKQIRVGKLHSYIGDLERRLASVKMFKDQSQIVILERVISELKGLTDYAQR